MDIHFTKMHGAGNDFVMIDALSQELPQDLCAFTKKISHRKFGVGCDQILLVQKSESCDFKMEIYNADGGQVEMCGNGIRSFYHFLISKNLTQKDKLTVETLAGVITPERVKNKDGFFVKVDMGQPMLEASQIPFESQGQIINQMTHFGKDLNLPITLVSMGNPHCVVFVENLADYPVEEVGKLIENDAKFPKKTNVEFVEIVSKNYVKQRTWERGSGETFACGTGASAVCVAGVLTKKLEPKIQIELKGGILDLEWNQNSNRVFKTGPSESVYEGIWRDYVI